MMAPASLTDTIYLICRLLLSAFAVAAAANAIHYAHQDKPVYHRHMLVARIGAGLLGIAATMSCVDAYDNVFVRRNEITPFANWLWLFCFDLILPVYAFMLVRAWRQRDQAELELARLVVTDLLTGALNRRGFFDRAISTIGQARRAGQLVSVVMLDIDHFKMINDQSGHFAGDQVLKRFVYVVSLELRPGDLLGRLGGDEFAVLLPGSTDDLALQATERMRARVRADVTIPDGIVTISAGVAALLEGIEPEPALVTGLSVADTALYAAKQAGRDRAHLAPSPVPSRQSA